MCRGGAAASRDIQIQTTSLPAAVLALPGPLVVLVRPVRGVCTDQSRDSMGYICEAISLWPEVGNATQQMNCMHKNGAHVYHSRCISGDKEVQRQCTKNDRL